MLSPAFLTQNYLRVGLRPHSFHKNGLCPRPNGALLRRNAPLHKQSQKQKSKQVVFN
jgi:hypothetical protein